MTMSSATKTRRSNSAAAEREHHRTNLWAQLARFIGLFGAPPIGLLSSWLVHLWVAGINVHGWVIDWEVHTSPAAVTVAVCLITLATVGTSYLAHQFAEHRKPALKNALAGSVIGVGILFAINVGTGPHYWWSGLLLVGGWTVAVVWSIARLDVARNDKQGDEQKEDGFLEKHGLKGWMARNVKPIFSDKGERIATEIEFQHAEGDVVEQLQDAVPAFESATGSPAGLSSATGSDRADRSTARLMHRDPLKEPRRTTGASSPGGSVSEPLFIGTYSNGEPVRMMIAGKPHAQLVSSVLWMGMTGTGKTTAENKAITEMESRRDVVIFYANKSKGMQDIRPIIPGVEAAVIADEVEQGAIYRAAMGQLKRILTYRSDQLGLFGVSEWTTECFSSPPWRTDEHGNRVQMEPMPFLFAHFGEADAILAEDSRGQSTYLASKGRSVGIATSWSLQRADYQMMPTGLRYNLGTSVCHGCGDDDSVGFALPKNVIVAGAHPDQWSNRKPGYFYYVGQSIDESLFPIFARSDGLGPDGGNLFDSFLKQNMEWAPRMAKLDSGSVAATDYEKDGKSGNWWRETVAETDRLRDRILRGGPATTSAKPAPQTSSATSQSADDDELTDEEVAEIDRETREEMREEMENTTHVEGVELYPQFEDGTGATSADAKKEHVPVPDDEELTWEPAEPAPRDKQAAITELRRALVVLAENPKFKDRGDPTGRTSLVTMNDILDEYKFRSRPWLVAILRDMATGALDGPAGHAFSRPEGDRKFMIQRIPDGNAQ
jgi:hypothetical protein